MDREQLGKVFFERNELEYLFDDNQWLPAAIERYQAGSHHQPYITLRLLSHPANHSGRIYLSDDDIKHRLRIKGSN